MTTWFRLPLIVRAAATGVGWLVYFGLILRLLPAEGAVRITVPVGVACILGSVVTAVADHRIHGRFGSVECLTEYRRALRTGKLPKGADVDEWARRLHGSEMAHGAAALCVLSFVVLGLFTSVGSESPYRWLPVAVFALILGWGVVVVVRRGAGIRQLNAAIERRGEPTTPPAAPRPQDVDDGGRVRVIAGGSPPVSRHWWAWRGRCSARTATCAAISRRTTNMSNTTGR